MFYKILWPNIRPKKHFVRFFNIFLNETYFSENCIKEKQKINNCLFNSTSNSKQIVCNELWHHLGILH